MLSDVKRYVLHQVRDVHKYNTTTGPLLALTFRGILHFLSSPALAAFPSPAVPAPSSSCQPASASRSPTFASITSPHSEALLRGQRQADPGCYSHHSRAISDIVSRLSAAGVDRFNAIAALSRLFTGPHSRITPAAYALLLGRAEYKTDGN